VPSYVYRELLGCSERREPWRDATREGEVRGAVDVDACFILRLVSLGGCEWWTKNGARRTRRGWRSL
jgi:hypothetical protein